MQLRILPGKLLIGTCKHLLVLLTGQAGLSGTRMRATCKGHAWEVPRPCHLHELLNLCYEELLIWAVFLPQGHHSIRLLPAVLPCSAWRCIYVTTCTRILCCHDAEAAARRFALLKSCNNVQGLPVASFAN